MSDVVGVPVSLGDPLRLPCGSILKNRIAKAAMSDSLGDGRGDATGAQARLYARWARGGVGLSIVGEVQGDPHYPEKPGNLIIDASSDVVALRALAEAGSGEGSTLWAQLGHAGALADPGLATGCGPSLLDISGGTYFPGARSASDSGGGGPYFVAFARRARRRTSITLMVTGGFRHELEATAALASGDVDVVGLARALVIDPDLPARWLGRAASGGEVGDSDPLFPRFDSPPPGGITAWYTMRLTALADDREDEMSGDLDAAVLAYDRRDAARRNLWRARPTASS